MFIFVVFVDFVIDMYKCSVYSYQSAMCLSDVLFRALFNINTLNNRSRLFTLFDTIITYYFTL